MIHLEEELFRFALGLRDDQGLDLPDSIVLASVLTHLEESDADEEKCFLQRDRKDFLTPEIQDAVAQRGCRTVGSFVNGLGLIQSTI